MLALGLVVSTMILSDTYEETRTLNTITVKGYAEIPIVSDMATWSGKVEVRGQELSLTVGKLAADMERVKAYLAQAGFAASDIEVSPVNTYYQYQKDANGYQTNIIAGTVANQTVHISSSDVEQVKSLSVDISELIQSGIELESYNPRYNYTKLNDLKMKLLGDATENAYERAKVIAENGDSDVGTLKYASQGVFQITSDGSNEVSDYGIIDQSSINKLAKAVVTAEFSID